MNINPFAGGGFTLRQTDTTNIQEKQELQKTFYFMTKANPMTHSIQYNHIKLTTWFQVLRDGKPVEDK
jgi:hypothetical protein